MSKVYEFTWPVFILPVCCGMLGHPSKSRDYTCICYAAEQIFQRCKFRVVTNGALRSFLFRFSSH